MDPGSGAWVDVDGDGMVDFRIHEWHYANTASSGSQFSVDAVFGEAAASGNVFMRAPFASRFTFPMVIAKTRGNAATTGGSDGAGSSGGVQPYDWARALAVDSSMRPAVVSRGASGHESWEVQSIYYGERAMFAWNSRWVTSGNAYTSGRGDWVGTYYNLTTAPVTRIALFRFRPGGGSDVHWGALRLQVGPQVRSDGQPPLSGAVVRDWIWSDAPDNGGDLRAFHVDFSAFGGNAPAVPEPGTLALLGTGAAGLAALRKRGG